MNYSKHHDFSPFVFACRFQLYVGCVFCQVGTLTSWSIITIILLYGDSERTNNRRRWAGRWEKKCRINGSMRRPSDFSSVNIITHIARVWINRVKLSINPARGHK